MRQAIPFHPQMEAYFGAYSAKAEPLVWFGGAVVGALFCKILYDIMAVVSPLRFKIYRGLPREKQVEWDNRGFSTAHAIYCTLVGGYLLFVGDVFSDAAPYGPIPFRSSILSYFTMAFSTGYFLADLAMILWTYPALGGPEYVMHHLLSIGSLVLANYTCHAHYYVLMVLFSEVSTPFINFRWYLLTSGLKNSKAFLYNGMAVLIVWLFARVLLFVHFFYHIYTHFDQISLLYPPGFYYLFIAPPTLALMNLFWFYKIVAGALRVFTNNKSKD